MGKLKKVVELLLCALIGVVWLALFLLWRLSYVFKRPGDDSPPSLLMLDMSYTLKMIQTMGNVTALETQSLGGFFERVYYCHPCSTLVDGESPGEQFGVFPLVTQFDERTWFYEGRKGLTPYLQGFEKLNFLLGQFVLVARLDRLIVERGVRVVKTSDPYYAGMLGVFLTKIHRLPLSIRVNSNYDRIREDLGGPFLPRLFNNVKVEEFVQRSVLPHFDLVMAPTQQYLDFALANGARGENTAILPFTNILHPAHFEPLERRSGGEATLTDLPGLEKPILVYVGRLTALKLLHLLLDMMVQLKEMGREASLVLVGDGEEEQRLRALAEDMGVQDRVYFAGRRDQLWMARFYTQCSMFVATQGGRSLTESALASLPAVVFDIDWHSELIENDVTGQLIPPHDTKQFAAAVKRLLDDEELRQRLGRNLRERVLATMDKETLLDRERQLYRDLLS